MSFVTVSADVVSASSQSMQAVGSALSRARTDVAGSTTLIAVAAQDEVSAAVSQVFSAYGQQYQDLAARVEVFHEQFVQGLRSAALSYSAAEAASTSLLSSSQQQLADVVDVIGKPLKGMKFRPIIGNGKEALRF